MGIEPRFEDARLLDNHVGRLKVGSLPGKYWSFSLDDLLREQRKTNRILLMAFGEAIENRVKGFLAHGQTKAVLTILSEGEVAADALQARAKTAGVPRSSLYKILADLERAGVVDRPRRGTVELASFAVPFVPASRKAAGGKDDEPSDAPEQVELEEQQS